MPENPNPPKHCKAKDCQNFYANNREGATLAYREGWFIQRNGDVYCPHHIPDWVGTWRKRVKERTDF